MALTFGQRGTKNKEVPFKYCTYQKDKQKLQNSSKKKKQNRTEVQNNSVLTQEDDAKKNTKKQRYDFSPLATVAYQYPVQSTSIFGLSFFFFFFLTSRFPFSGRNTPIFGRYDPIWPESALVWAALARVGKKKNTWQDATRRSARVFDIMSDQWIWKKLHSHVIKAY